MPRLTVVSGVPPILLHFKLVRIPQPVQLKSEPQNILVKLTRSGFSDENLANFQGFLLGTPEPFKIRLVDAYKTNQSVLLMMRVTWETWARMSSAIEYRSCHWRVTDAPSWHICPYSCSYSSCGRESTVQISIAKNTKKKVIDCF